MLRTYVVPLLAIAGVVVAVYTVVQGSKPPMPTPPAVEPPSAPYEHFVAGSGLVEASTQNIAVGTPMGGVVSEVRVKVGDGITAGQPLFQLDDRVERAEVNSREAALRIAESQLAKLRLGTRPEELPPARARVSEAETSLKDLESQLDMWEKVKDDRAVSADDLSRRRFAVQAARSRLDEAKAALVLLESGTWAADISVAEAQVQSARAQLEAKRVDLERLTITSKIAGKVLQVNVRAGEFAQAGPLATPLMIVGSVSPLHVRVDVDEHDAWRVQGGAEAVAFVRGNKDISSPLQFVRFEPFVIPKRSLTGESTERVDTRVLQVIYSFEPKDLPIYVGQQMDVYIKADPDPRQRNAVEGAKTESTKHN